MFKRVMVAVVGIPALVLLLGFAPAWAALLVTMALCGVGAHEFLHAVAGEGGKKLLRLTVLAAAVLPAMVYSELAPQEPQPAALADFPLTALPDFPLTAALSLTFVVLLFLSAILEYGSEQRILLSDLTAALFAGVVFPLMLSCLVRLRLAENGAAWVFLPLCISFGSDTFALFAGMLCGKHKLAPLVSPKKTQEGAAGGLLGGVFGILVFKWIGEAALHTALVGYLPAVALGLVGSAVSQIGDLSFSVVKREFGVKDYGKLLPGHGGVLDRFDSVTFTAPLVWLLLSFL